MQQELPQVQVSQASQQRQSLANNLLNARMPGASTEERNIYNNEANNQGNINRNATSGSQALAMGAAGNAQAGQNIQNLGVKEQQDYYNRLANENSALGNTQSEQVRTQEEKLNLTNALKGGAMQDRQSAFNSIGNFGISMAPYIGGMGGNGGGGPVASPNNSFMTMNPAQQGGYSPSGMPAYLDPSQMPNLSIANMGT